ncbi:MAG: NTP transferase domain-containing protein [Deltaproteobacteria bacterium]|nr:NTP transferase domain-containing protein [Candidatus Anaeroferrophillus wilburensis]MBN2890148.1 NTP transferase domain-containing protein [Deltaproteobacteria bacterium]
MNGWSAMVLAAGYGTRLRPLTLQRPKPLVPVANQPLLDIVLRHLFKNGAGHAVVNGHHLSPQVRDFLAASPWRHRTSFLHEEAILGTGGGIRNAASRLVGDFFVTVNSDVVTDLDLAPVIAFHRRQNPLVTMVFHDHPRFNSVLIDNQQVVSFEPESASAAGSRQLLAYTGIQICSPRLFPFLQGADFLSLVDAYQWVLRNQREEIAAFIMPADSWYWRDLGSFADYFEVHQDLSRQPQLAISLLGHPPVFPLVDSQAAIEDAVLQGATVVGPRCRVGNQTMLEDAIVWPEVTIGRGCRVVRSILGSTVVVPDGTCLVDQVVVRNGDKGAQQTVNILLSECQE